MEVPQHPSQVRGVDILQRVRGLALRAVHVEGLRPRARGRLLRVRVGIGARVLVLVLALVRVRTGGGGGALVLQRRRARAHGVLARVRGDGGRRRGGGRGGAAGVGGGSSCGSAQDTLALVLHVGAAIVVVRAVRGALARLVLVVLPAAAVVRAALLRVERLGLGLEFKRPGLGLGVLVWLLLVPVAAGLLVVLAAAAVRRTVRVALAAPFGVEGVDAAVVFAGLLVGRNGIGIASVVLVAALLLVGAAPVLLGAGPARPATDARVAVEAVAWRLPRRRGRWSGPAGTGAAHFRAARRGRQGGAAGAGAARGGAPCQHLGLRPRRGGGLRDAVVQLGAPERVGHAVLVGGHRLEGVVAHAVRAVLAPIPRRAVAVILAQHPRVHGAVADLEHLVEALAQEHVLAPEAEVLLLHAVLRGLAVEGRLVVLGELVQRSGAHDLDGAVQAVLAVVEVEPARHLRVALDQ
mmetsp:Transcript_22378/g.63502  ORF Transcript_22378/g.63502 Transcript_22378/m.63502 type:complete len:465 (+) Transcript_22378:958-2352(+)